MTNPQQPVRLILSDGFLIVKPPLDCVKDDLTYEEKSLVSDPERPWKDAEVITENKPMYVLYEEQADGTITEPMGTGTAVLATRQGFYTRIADMLLDRNIMYLTTDKRIANATRGTFPYPDFSKMHGFRFSQRELLETALAKNMSGMIGAPTRYGKTSLMVNTCRAYPTLNILVVAPGVDLVIQLYEDFTGPRGIKDRDIRLICTGHNGQPSDDGITICTVTSLHKVDPRAFDLVLYDEPHDLVSEKRLELVDAFTKARRLAFGATLEGKFSGRDAYLPGVFGPVLSNITYEEARDEGAISPITVLVLAVEVSPAQYSKRDQAYKHVLLRSEAIGNMIGQICHDIIPEDMQTLVFIKEEVQADLYKTCIGRAYLNFSEIDEAVRAEFAGKSVTERKIRDEVKLRVIQAADEYAGKYTIAMAKKLSNKERNSLTARMNDTENPVTRCLCSKIFIQGVTFHDLRVLINAEGGGGNTGTIQKPGRLAETRPGKKCGIMIDIAFVPEGGHFHDTYDEKNKVWTCSVQGSRHRALYELWAAPVIDSLNRRKVYRNIGYDVIDVHDLAELEEKFNQLI